MVCSISDLISNLSRVLFFATTQNLNYCAKFLKLLVSAI